MNFLLWNLWNGDFLSHLAGEPLRCVGLMESCVSDKLLDNRILCTITNSNRREQPTASRGRNFKCYESLGLSFQPNGKTESNPIFQHAVPFHLISKLLHSSHQQLGRTPARHVWFEEWHTMIQSQSLIFWESSKKLTFSLFKKALA